MRLNKSMMLGAVLLAVACGGSQVEDTEYAESTPDLAGVSLEINSDSDEAAKLTAEDFNGVYAQALGGASEYLDGARAEVKSLNASLRDIITRIATLANGDIKTLDKGQVATYGPTDLDGANYRLQVKKLGDKRFAWKLEARAQGSTDDKGWTLVGAGKLNRGAAAHRGRGQLAINLDKLKSVVPSTPGQGKLMTSFAHTAGDDKALSYRLVNFTANAANHEPVTGFFVGYRLLPSRFTAVRVLGKYNLSASATAAKENVFARIRFAPGKGGRADILASGGDIANKHVYLGSACWDAQEKEGFKVVRECVKGTAGDLGSCTVVSTVGELTACHPDLRGEVTPPSDDPNDSTPEPGAPTETPDAAPDDVTADF